MLKALAFEFHRKYRHQTAKTEIRAIELQPLMNRKITDQNEIEVLPHLPEENESPDHDADFLSLRIPSTTETKRRSSNE